MFLQSAISLIRRAFSAGWPGLILILAFYTAAQVINFTPATNEPDTDGYIELARRIAHGGPIATVEHDLFQWQNHVWVENTRGELLPKYAPGFPLIMALFYRAGGANAMFLASPVMGGLALIGAFLLFRLWMSPLPVFLATLTLAANPMFINYATFPLTHATDVCIATWGAYLLWRWHSNPRVISGSIAGLLIGFAGAVRFTNLTLALMMATAIGAVLYRERRTGGKPHAAIAALAGGFGFVMALLAIYNWRYFGHPLHTGYYLSGEQGAFTLTQFLANHRLLIKGLADFCLFGFFGLGLAGLIACGPIPDRSMRLSWSLPVFLVYASYYWAPPEISYYRFMITILPVMIGAAFLFMARLNAGPSARIAAMLALTLIVLTQNLPDLRAVMAGRALSNRAAGIDSARQFISRTTAPDAVIFSREPFNLFFGAYRRHRLYDLASFNPWFAARGMPAQDSRHLQPKSQPMRSDRLRKFYAGTSAAQFLELKLKLIAGFLADRRQVVMFIHESMLKQEQNALGENFTFTPLASWPPECKHGCWYVYEVKRVTSDRPQTAPPET